MKLSLVIPVHNLEDYIEPLLVSLKIQLYDLDEIEPIFICDSCDDKTHEIIEASLKDTYRNLKILDRNYHSSGLSRNDGIEEARGAYIWLLDGDDWIIDNYAFTKVMACLEANPDEKIIHVNWISNNFAQRDYLHTVWQWVIRSDTAKEIKFTSRKYDDDVEYITNLLSYIKPAAVKNVNSPLYFYNYMRAGSVMFNRILDGE